MSFKVSVQGGLLSSISSQLQKCLFNLSEGGGDQPFSKTSLQDLEAVKTDMSIFENKDLVS